MHRPMQPLFRLPMTPTDQQPRIPPGLPQASRPGDESGRVVPPDARPASSPPCRTGCGACCIAPSISTAIPGMPHGKPAGVPCVQLDAQLRCQLFGRPERPAVCGSLQPSAAMCGSHRGQAMAWLARLETLTAPDQPVV